MEDHIRPCCKILGLHSGKDSSGSLLGWDDVYFCFGIPLFWMTVLKHWYLTTMLHRISIKKTWL